MEPPLWSEGASPRPHEREALAFVRARLPNHEPYRAWTNVEFIAEDGSVDKLAELRAAHPWVQADTTAVVDSKGRTRWWTFAGWKANLHLAHAAARFRHSVAAIDDLTIALDPGTMSDALTSELAGLGPADAEIAPWITDEAIDGLKFSQCLPRTQVPRS